MACLDVAITSGCGGDCIVAPLGLRPARIGEVSRFGPRSFGMDLFPARDVESKDLVDSCPPGVEPPVEEVSRKLIFNLGTGFADEEEFLSGETTFESASHEKFT